jgi:hypothetical protein
MEKAKSLQQVNKALQEKFPGIFLTRGKGYYYIWSDDETIQLKLAGLYTTSIPVYSIKEQTVERWIEDVKELLEQK